MARGTKLADLRYMLLAEIGDNSNPNNLRRKEIDTLLSNKQKWLSSEYDWPFLQHKWDVLCPANTQYVTLPTVDVRGVTAVIDWERPVRTNVFYNTIYGIVDYGVGADEYNWQNFTLGQQSDPIQRYQLVSNAGDDTYPDQIEVWPVPVSNQALRFTGQRALDQMVADDDTADLDDMLLVYFVASEMLMRKKQADAGEKLALAKERLGKLLRVYPSRQETLIIGESHRHLKFRRHIAPTIAIAGVPQGGVSVVQIYTYVGATPTDDGLVPGNVNSPALAYKLGGAGPMFTWNTTTHVWE